jgi:NADH dehydrogenase (ubiquinone) 1 alpha subcomplex subunit 8
MPDHIPKVKEIGASSAPLMSASYFIGARCKPYNDDYMQCKTEAYGRGELDCLKEGRKVTRCAASVYVLKKAALATNALTRAAIRLKDINENCLEVFREHWNCLDNNNHQMWQCRRPERRLNRCVFEKLVRFIPLSGHLQPTMLTADLRG